MIINAQKKPDIMITMVNTQENHTSGETPLDIMIRMVNMSVMERGDIYGGYRIF